MLKDFALLGSLLSGLCFSRTSDIADTISHPTSFSRWTGEQASKSASHFSHKEKAKKASPDGPAPPKQHKRKAVPAWALRYKAFSFVGCLSRILSVRSLTSQSQAKLRVAPEWPFPVPGALPHSPRLMCNCARLFLNYAEFSRRILGVAGGVQNRVKEGSHSHYDTILPALGREGE